MLLAVNSLAHLLVDALCAAAVFGPIRNAGSLTMAIIIYNTLAFSTQCLVGLAADRLRCHCWAACGSMLLVIAGFALPLPVMARVALIGIGNSVFHVAGGAMTLERSAGKAGPLGVFVAPGCVGLVLGTLWPQLGVTFAVLLTLCAIGVVLLGRDAELTTQSGAAKPGGEAGLLVTILLTAAVAVRAVGGSAVSFPWKTGAGLTLLMTGFVFAGKTAGGFVCDRLGVRKTAFLSIIPAAVLIAFFSWSMPLSLAGQLTLNLTMPVTLWLLYRAMPDAPGFSFGLAASALWPGTIAGQLMQLTGPALWVCVIVSFVFGLWAILFSCKRIFKYKLKKEGKK